ncbi:MAG: hypothetical protein ATN31_01100 [Candidatus Epulonipiscioides saccharophilum]|nr:MAG: hypothetical protein ATN31_01100 [Epulopiscium sp. AS2M-Bin001]
MFSEYIIEDFKNLEELRKKYPKLIFRHIDNAIYIVEVPVDGQSDLDLLTKKSAYIQNSYLYGLNSEESLQEAGILIFHNYPYGQLRGNGVLIGFLDTGIDYTNDVFKYEDGTTRILSIWDQTLEGKAPFDFGFGAEFSREELNKALKADDPLSVIATKDDVGHGTYIAGLAAGSDRIGDTGYIGAAPDSDLVIVKLRPAPQSLKDIFYVKESITAYSDGSILTAISYLVKKATELEKPLVICITVGNNFGGHDGTNIIERYIQSLTLVPGIIVVVAAGNEGNSGHHYKNTVTEGEKRGVEINVAKDENGFDLSLWTRNVDKMSVGIRTPIGQVVERVPLKPYKREEFTFSLQKSKVTVEYKYPESNTGGESIRISLKDPIPGIWHIDIYGDYIIDGTFDMWIPRTGFVEANTRFSEPNLETTVCVPATGIYSIVVGGYDEIDKSLYAASGRGPTRHNITKPDIIAPSIAVSGPMINDVQSTYTGTSVGAAITAGACALLLEWSIVEANMPTINTRVAKEILARGGSRSPGITYPSNVEGFGKLDFQNSFLVI